MSPSQVIVLATPVFLLLIAAEVAWGIARGRNTYRLNDAVNSIGLGMLSEITKVFTRLLRVGIYTAVYAHVSLVPPGQAQAFWSTWYGWLLALLFYDFCYYWLHRAGHEVAVFWAAHVVHHQSQDYNLSTALRQTSSGALLGWIFYLPMALAGVPPLVFGVVALVDLLYQFWVHTEHVPKLGWFDRWFCSPSNHRVHHAVNDRYLDRNYGGVLIVWDRLFGTFREEEERCVYGTRTPLESWDPLWSNFEVYWALARDSWHTRRWSDKLRVWIKPPGWRPADVAARFPRPAFELQAVRRFDPPVSRSVAWTGAAHFVLLLGAVSIFLWHADGMAAAPSLVWLAALTAVLWGIGALLQGRLTPLELLMVETAVLATATSALGLLEWHRWFKPLALLLVMGMVAAQIRLGAGTRRRQALLLAGLALSLAGDCLLMFEGFFIPGLVAFLAAHVCYIALFKQGHPWFPGRTALFATLGAGAAMYAFLFGSLGPVLKVAVGAYVIVIALMAAQAIGRAGVLRDRASAAVAAGAVLFMVSDSLLATNRFALPLPLAQLWVLATYYAAQILIARHALASGAGPAVTATAAPSASSLSLRT
ncbi:MAG TPA: lysoplasmalogenase family protein [Ramlibacter sp.]